MDACFSPNGKQLLSAGLDKTLRFWDVETGKELRCQTLAERQFTVAFSPDGKRAPPAARIMVSISGTWSRARNCTVISATPTA